MNERPPRPRGAGRVFRRPGSKFVWVQYYSARGEQIRVSSGETDEQKAERFLRKKIGQVEAGVHRDTRRVTYASLRDAYYQDYENNERKSLRHDSEGKPYLDKVVRLDQFFSGYNANDIDTDLIRKFIAHQKGKALENATINRSLSALRRMFSIARKDGRLGDVPYFPMLKEAAPRQGFIEREQYETLSHELRSYLRLPVALGYFTGMRAGEILSLKWEHIDFLEKVIRLRARQRTIPHAQFR
jgi:integrase